MSGENKNADVQWLVTLASDGIWPSVTEVGPSVLSPSLCSTVLFHSVHSAVPACAPHAHCLSHSSTFPQYASLQAKSPNPADMCECSSLESQHEEAHWGKVQAAKKTGLSEQNDSTFPFNTQSAATLNPTRKREIERKILCPVSSGLILFVCKCS